MSRKIYGGLFIAFLAAILTATPTVHAQTTWYVDDDAPNDPGPGDPTVSDPDEDGSLEHPFDAIQEGITVAVDGETVLVLGGTYTADGNKNLDFGGKPITVRSESGPEYCIIDCQASDSDRHRAFGFHSGETAAAVVDGLTITNGYALGGGGLYCTASSPTLINCTFITNGGGWGGGGVYCENGSNPTLVNCTFSGNWASYHIAAYGGGIANGYSNPTLINCEFNGNVSQRDGGGVFNWFSSPTVINCTFSGNEARFGGGMCSTHDPNQAPPGYYGPTLVNCTFSGNVSQLDGGGMYNRASSSTVVNCILWGNGPDEIIDNNGAATTVGYSDVQGGWPGEGSIDADPQFVRHPNDGGDGWGDDPNTPEDESANDDYGDLRLQAGSPCIDAADNEAVPADTLDLDGDGDTTEPIPIDLDGNPRFVDDPNTDDTGNGAPPIVDMGAYEFQAGIVAHLDIKPGSCPNPLNVQSHGVLPAAIVGTAEFDVTQIDVDTLVLTRADGVGGGVTPLMGPPGPGIRVNDVATPFDGEPCDCHDLGADGIDDLTMKFDTETLVTELQLADLPGGTSVELVISGQLLDGTQFAGTDCITIRPVGPQPGAALGAVDQDESTPQPASETTTTEPQETERQETEQEAFATPSAACGVLSPAFLATAILAMSLAHCRRRRGPV